MASIEGRWDITVSGGPDTYPSWVEIGGVNSSFVGRFGSARPVPTVKIDGNSVTWQLPPQYESRKDDLMFQGHFENGTLSGSTILDDGTPGIWSAVRAPEMPLTTPDWGSTISLIGPDDVSAWTLRSPNWEGHWSVVDGALHNSAVGSDLVTKDVFGDFKLVAEYSYPKGSNSGIYLRGRYEFQIVDDFGSGPAVGSSGAIYGFLEPSVNAVKEHDQWNTAEITLIGRFVTVVLNGVTVVDGKEIPGITGGALDSNEGAPGHFFLQGDHGPVTFRRLDLTVTK